jgi:aspartyl/asparaginyl-tRNA synthetase
MVMTDMKTAIANSVLYMKESKSVEDWNKRREVVYKSFDRLYPEVVEAIDGADRETGVSLIVSVLGKD